MYDKQSLIGRLKELPLNENEYWVVAGAAMVLHGFRPQTRDIDLGCSTLLADKLEQQGFSVSRCEDGSRKIVYSEDIELFENWLEGAVEKIDGVPVVCADGLIQMKKKLGREKDLSDIALIKKGPALLNSNLSMKPSKNAVFSRCFACFVFQPYVFSLVFALTS